TRVPDLPPKLQDGYTSRPCRSQALDHLLRRLLRHLLRHLLRSLLRRLLCPRVRLLLKLRRIRRFATSIRGRISPSSRRRFSDFGIRRASSKRACATTTERSPSSS